MIHNNVTKVSHRMILYVSQIFSTVLKTAHVQAASLLISREAAKKTYKIELCSY